MKQVFSITSDSNHTTDGRVLSLRLGEKHFGFSITAREGNELYKLYWYSDTAMDENKLREVYLQHPELRESFVRTQICYDHPQSVLVPDAFASADDAGMLLETMYGINGRDTVITERVDNWQLQNQYRIPEEIHNWVNSHFPGNNSWHAYTIALQHTDLSSTDGWLAVDFRPEDFSLIVTRGNKLMLAQTYSYATPADVIYYLLNTCREFSFTQESVQVSLSGLVDKESALYRELHSYFLQLSFREPAWTLQGAGTDYPAHFFTSLNDLSLCAS